MYKILVSAVTALVLSKLVDRITHKNDTALDKIIRSLPAPVKGQLKSLKLDARIPTRKLNRGISIASKYLAQEIKSNRKDARKALKLLAKTLRSQQKSVGKYIRTI